MEAYPGLVSAVRQFIDEMPPSNAEGALLPSDERVDTTPIAMEEVGMES